MTSRCWHAVSITIKRALLKEDDNVVEHPRFVDFFLALPPTKIDRLDAAAIRTCKEQPYGVMCGEEGSILSKKKSADRERTPR